MQIEKNKVATLHYTLKDNNGNLLDRSDDGSFVYLHGAMSIIPGLENALADKVTGDSFSVKVTPDEGYGIHDDSRIQEVPKNMFENTDDIQLGMQFNAEGPNGEMLTVTVTEIKDDTVTIDGNHPLSGKELNFDVKVVDVREASEGEIKHGHVHGEHGHQH